MTLLASITLPEVLGWTIVCLACTLWGAMGLAR